jgi:hypothetical protein
MKLIGGSWDPASISALAAISRRDLLAKRMFHRGSVFVSVFEVTSLVALNTFNQFVTH